MKLMLRQAYDFRTMIKRQRAIEGRVRPAGSCACANDIKVKCHLMFGILVLAVDQIFRVTASPPARRDPRPRRSAGGKSRVQ